VLNIDVKFKMNGREVGLDLFMEAFAGRIAKEIGGEIEQRFGALRVAERAPAVPRRNRLEPKAVGIKEAAGLIGISPSLNPLLHITRYDAGNSYWSKSVGAHGKYPEGTAGRGKKEVRNSDHWLAGHGHYAVGASQPRLSIVGFPYGNVST
jgi:hypothetical protein